jgi:hypothetical protein
MRLQALVNRLNFPILHGILLYRKAWSDLEKRDNKKSFEVITEVMVHTMNFASKPRRSGTCSTSTFKVREKNRILTLKDFLYSTMGRPWRRQLCSFNFYRIDL